MSVQSLDIISVNLWQILISLANLLIIYLIQPTVRSAFLLSGSFALIYGLAAHYLIYGMWGYEGAARLLFTRTFPSAVSTAVFGMGCFWLVWKIRLAFEDAAR